MTNRYIPEPVGTFTLEWLVRELNRVSYDLEQLHMSGYDFGLEVAKGNVPGHSIVNKFGRNIVITKDAEEFIWDGGGTYSFPASASLTHIRSAVDSATTQGLAIEVQGLDTNWDLTIQTATLDGTDSTTEVALTTALRRVFRLKVNDSGVADEAIQVGPTGFATQGAIITAGNNQTLMAIYTVPANKTAYIVKHYATLNLAATPNLTGALLKRWHQDNANSYSPQLKSSMGMALAGSSDIDHEYELPERVTEKTDIYLTATAEGAAADVSAGFDLYLVDN